MASLSFGSTAWDRGRTLSDGNAGAAEITSELALMETVRAEAMGTANFRTSCSLTMGSQKTEKR